MIHPELKVMDLDPVVWNKLGSIEKMCFPERRILYVLHEGHKVLNIYEEVIGWQNQLEPFFELSNPQAFSHHVFKEYTGIDEVWIIEKKNLIEYYKIIHSNSFREMDSDEYVYYTRKLLHNFKGISIFRRDEHSENTDFYDKAVKYVKERLPPNCTFILGVFHGEKLYYNVVLGFEKHKLRMVTTFENIWGEPGAGRSITPADAAILKEAAQKKYNTPVFVEFVQKSAS